MPPNTATNASASPARSPTEAAAAERRLPNDFPSTTDLGLAAGSAPENLAAARVPRTSETPRGRTSSESASRRTRPPWTSIAMTRSGPTGVRPRQAQPSSRRCCTRQPPSRGVAELRELKLVVERIVAGEPVLHRGHPQREVFDAPLCGRDTRASMCGRVPSCRVRTRCTIAANVSLALSAKSLTPVPANF